MNATARLCAATAYGRPVGAPELDVHAGGATRCKTVDPQRAAAVLVADAEFEAG